MDQELDTLKGLVAHLEKVAPEVLDLATAKTELQFAEFLDRLLERAIRHLEDNSKNFKELNEVGLSAVVAALFNGMPGLHMVQEGYANGHVDLSITVHLAHPIQRRLVEAKIENGPAYHEKGLTQLLCRYSSGRDRYSWLLAYVREKGIKDRMDAIRDYLDGKKPCGQTGACQDHKLRWSFLTNHNHDSSGDAVTVTHVGFNLYAGG